MNWSLDFDGHCERSKDLIWYKTNHITSFPFYIHLYYPKMGLLHHKPFSFRRSPHHNLSQIIYKNPYLPFPVSICQCSVSVMDCGAKGAGGAEINCTLLVSFVKCPSIL